MRTSPNSHVIYGQVVDVNGLQPQFKFNNNQIVTSHIDTLTGTFYVDESDMTNVTTPITSLNEFTLFSNNSNILSINKISLDTSHVTSMYGLFNCSTSTSNNNTLKYIDISGLDISSCTSMVNAFRQLASLEKLYLYNIDMSNIDTSSMFYYNFMPPSLSNMNIYINNINTLNKLTNNLTKANTSGYSNTQYIPSLATIHYDNGSEVIDYKWQNNAWTPQS